MNTHLALSDRMLLFNELSFIFERGRGGMHGNQYQKSGKDATVASLAKTKNVLEATAFEVLERLPHSVVIIDALGQIYEIRTRK